MVGPVWELRRKRLVHAERIPLCTEEAVAEAAVATRTLPPWRTTLQSEAPVATVTALGMERMEPFQRRALLQTRAAVAAVAAGEAERAAPVATAEQVVKVLAAT